MTFLSTRIKHFFYHPKLRYLMGWPLILVFGGMLTVILFCYEEDSWYPVAYLAAVYATVFLAMNAWKYRNTELENHQQKFWQLENQRARLILDIHDGIGGQLVSTLAMVELGEANRQQIAEALRDILDDIRLMIDVMDIQANDLTFVLAIFRTRMTRKLRNSQIELEWEINDIPSIANFDACKALLLLRILQTAISSAIKKEQTTKIRLKAHLIQQQTQKSAVVIEIYDNGKSLDNADSKTYEYMHKQAQSAGCSLFFESGLSGTTVRLVLDYN